jgi:hypothetical protein
MPPATPWETSIDELVAVYRDIEQRSLWLPTISVYPFVITTWNTFKCVVYLLLDAFLIPLNFVIFVRNLLPGRWSYRSFSGPYLKYAALWVWHGESPQSAFVVVQWLVTSLLHLHFRSRLSLLRRRIHLENKLTAEEQARILARIDRILEGWQGPRIITGFFAYGLPLAGFLLELYRGFGAIQLPAWTREAGLLLLIYAPSVVGTAVMLKRGLMLGGTDRSIYFPGTLVGRGAYAEEARILGALGLARREFPLDLVLFLVGIGLSMGLVFLRLETVSDEEILRHLRSTLGSDPPQEAFEWIIQRTRRIEFWQKVFVFGQVTLVALLSGLALLRRRKLARA